MILTIDIGNSNIVLGGVRGEEIVFEARLRTEATKTSDQYCVDLKILLDVYGVNREDIEGAIIASVVPQVLNSMQTAVKKLTGKQSLVVGPGLKTGLNILLENPGQTGADLVVGCVLCFVQLLVPSGVGVVLTILSEALLILSLFRCFSRNTYKRYNENRKFLLLIDRVKDRTHRYYTCPKCRQTVRVPKGKGKIAITCPKCREKFVKKT